jgi:hypothetical protein
MFSNKKNMTLALAQHLFHVEAASKHQTDDDICHDIGMMMTKGKSDSKPCHCC